MKKASITLLFFLLSSISIKAEVYKPPNYAFGSNLEGTSFSFDLGFREIDGDYFVMFNPILQFPFMGFRVGLQIPLEILVYDKEPKRASRVPSLRPGTFDEKEDYLKMVKYIAYGTHLYFDPEDSFNWSLHYGMMTDGYIGHRTIVNRYVSSYDPSVWSPGLMADINNNWGGIEIFANNVFRREVRGYRIFVRPVGIYNSIYNLAHFERKNIIASRKNHNKDYLFQTVPNPGKGGSLRQHLLRPLKEDLKESEVEFREVFNPETGEVEIKPFPKEEYPSPITQQEKENLENLTQEQVTERKHGFWNRWAIGYTVVTDYDAPLSIEFDGSGNLVVDPETKRPRADKTENLTIVGIDTEIRLSPFRWLEMTPYIDINRIKNLPKSKGTHIGVLFNVKISNVINFSFRPEYREVTSNYIPEYFDSTYAIERTQYLQKDTNSYTPKLTYLKSLPKDGAIKKGFFINSTLELVSFIFLELSYENYDGPNNSKIFVGFYLPNINGIFLNGYYLKKNFDKFKDAFVYKDKNALLAGEIGLVFFGGLYIKYTIQRTWTYNPEIGDYSPNDESFIGFGYGTKI